MTLASDVMDASGRLLLAKGRSIDSNHRHIFKMGGVAEVDINHEHNAQTAITPALGPEATRRAAGALRRAFGENDLTHPAVADPFRQALLHQGG